MKLDRNINADGHGKYALLLLRNLRAMPEGPEKSEACRCIDILAEHGIVDYGQDVTGFFVLRLKDRFAPKALIAYANEAEWVDKEYASEIYALAREAIQHPERKMPD